MPIQNLASFKRSDHERAGRHARDEAALATARADLEHINIQFRAPSDPLEVALLLKDRQDTSGPHGREK